MRHLKRIYLLAWALCLSAGLFAQKDRQAREVLDKTAAAIRQAGGIRATFGGTANGILLLKGEKFHLKTEGIQSWFDGKTQWSYLEESEEVNISNPTPEELQTVNPYSLLSLYKNGYRYQYMGTRKRNGKQGYEVTLTPEKEEDIASITLFVDTAYQPVYIKIEQANRTVSEIVISSCLTNQPLDDAAFRFDSKQYPNAEVIDLR